MATRKNSDEVVPKRRPPAKTPEGRENEMISLATDLAELQMREGRAPAPVIVHYLKLATEKEKLEREKIRLENKLLIKKEQQADQGERMEALYAKAIDSMRMYQGQADPEEYDVYDN